MMTVIHNKTISEKLAVEIEVFAAQFPKVNLDVARNSLVQLRERIASMVKEVGDRRARLVAQITDCEAIFPVRASRVSPMNTQKGEFMWQTFRDPITGDEYMALFKGNINAKGKFINGYDVPVRVHSADIASDVFAFVDGGGNDKKEAAIQKLLQEGEGCIILMPQQGLGMGLFNKEMSRHIQISQGLTREEANQLLGRGLDLRDFTFTAQILKSMGIRSIKLMSDSETKTRQLERGSVQVSAVSKLVDGVYTDFKPRKNAKEKNLRRDWSRLTSDDLQNIKAITFKQLDKLIRKRNEEAKLVKELSEMRHQHFKNFQGASLLFPTAYTSAFQMTAKNGIYYRQAFFDPIRAEAYLTVYAGDIDSLGHIVNSMGILIRPHSMCVTGDMFHSTWCECGPQKDEALEVIRANRAGIIIYIPHEGRGIGLFNKGHVYALQRLDGLDTIEADKRLGFQNDLRNYDVAGQILFRLGATAVTLLSNSGHKQASLEEIGIGITGRSAMVRGIEPSNFLYLLARALRKDYLVFKELDDDLAVKLNTVIMSLNTAQITLVKQLLSENPVEGNLDPKLINLLQKHQLM